MSTPDEWVDQYVAEDVRRKNKEEADAERVRSGLSEQITLKELVPTLDQMPVSTPIFGYLEIQCVTEFQWKQARALCVKLLTQKPKLTCDASPGHFTVASPQFRLRIIRPALQPR